jgi:hypothetical protein
MCVFFTDLGRGFGMRGEGGRGGFSGAVTGVGSSNCAIQHRDRRKNPKKNPEEGNGLGRLPVAKSQSEGGRWKPLRKETLGEEKTGVFLLTSQALPHVSICLDNESA